MSYSDGPQGDVSDPGTRASERADAEPRRRGESRVITEIGESGGVAESPDANVGRQGSTFAVSAAQMTSSANPLHPHAFYRSSTDRTS